VDARAGFVLIKERQEPAPQPQLAARKHRVSTTAAPVRRLPIGAEPQPEGGVHFRVWAPRCREVTLEIEGL
jgi:maltooligosyltrehalose trehalohydrolase